ncbi:MAG: acyltransferase domain-containing protein [Pseudomonadota bacterium]
MSRLLLLCPGQGGQHAAMFALARGDAGAAALLDRLGVDTSVEPASMFDNRVAQPAIVAATLAMWRAIGQAVATPALVAGYSVGELAAYAVAGALDMDEAVRLAGVRAALMDACAASHPGQCLSAIGALPARRRAALLEPAGFYVAIETGPESCIVGGPAAGLAALAARVRLAGGSSAPLPVAVAAHTPYMAAAVAPFAEALRATAFQAQRAPVLAGVSADGSVGKAMAVDCLSRQLAEKIIWTDCMDACAEAGITVALELGPGGALSRMLAARQPHIACRSVADFRTLDGIRQWLGRHLD